MNLVLLDNIIWLPRYNFISDASTVLNFLRKLPDDNVLPLKLLTFKLVMPIALVSGQRICVLVTEYMTL